MEELSTNWEIICARRVEMTQQNNKLNGATRPVIISYYAHAHPLTRTQPLPPHLNLRTDLDKFQNCFDWWMRPSCDVCVCVGVWKGGGGWPVSRAYTSLDVFIIQMGICKISDSSFRPKPWISKFSFLFFISSVVRSILLLLMRDDICRNCACVCAVCLPSMYRSVLHTEKKMTRYWFECGFNSYY